MSKTPGRRRGGRDEARTTGRGRGEDRRRRKIRDRELEGVNLLGLAPVRLAEWKESQGQVILTRPPPSSSGLARVLDRILLALSARRIRLDRVGSFAWVHFDGARTVGDVAGLLRAEFGAEVEPAEERLGRLVRVMRDEGFLGYPGYDVTASRPGRS